MQLTGTQVIASDRRRVWDALNDPDILRQAIPGCQTLTKEEDGRLRATVEIKIGPIGARFEGVVTLSDIDAPNGYTISGEGNGGMVGNAKGSANVRLADDPGGTALSYTVDAQVGGRLAQLGGPIIDATAKQLAAKFFGKFGTIVGGEPATEPPAVSSAAPSTAPASAMASGPVVDQLSRPTSHIPIAWLLALVVAALAGFLAGRGQGAGGSDWAGLAIGLSIFLVGATGIEIGRRASAPIVILDPALLAQLIRQDRR